MITGRSVAIVGAQWGDEGKGKDVDLLAAYADYVVRFNGGDNAGHTLVVDGKKTVLRMIPSGILLDKPICMIGNGCVVSLENLMDEITALIKNGINVKKRILVDDGAVLILPTHIALDKASEKAKGDNKIGTTNRGIGPAYEDKVGRRALHFYDLFSDDFETKLNSLMNYHNERLVNQYHQDPVEFKPVYEKLIGFRQQLESMRADVGSILSEARKKGSNIIYEGGQGMGLDIDHGTYPYVTSSNPIAPAACIGAGVGLHDIDYVLGEIKAYTTRVGAGPFVAELKNEIGDGLRDRGQEYGSVTGRPRRTGWIDMFALKKSTNVNGTDGFSIHKLDILDGMEEIGIVTGYKLNGRVLKYPPKDIAELSQCEPIIIKMPGWKEPTFGKTNLNDFPVNALNFLLEIEKLAGKPIDIISTGPDRHHTIMLYNPLSRVVKLKQTPLERACRTAKYLHSKAGTKTTAVLVEPSIVRSVTSVVAPQIDMTAVPSCEPDLIRIRSNKESFKSMFALWETKTIAEAKSDELSPTKKLGK